MYVEGVVKDTEGQPVANATIDTWETDGTGLYDTQVSSRNPKCTISLHLPGIKYDERLEPDCRGRLHTKDDGSYAFRAVVYVHYILMTYYRAHFS